MNVGIHWIAGKGRLAGIVSGGVLVLLLAGCGFSAGTWEDDPGNWKRAFGVEAPEGIRILQSRYWRSPHWTYEFEYFFVLEGTDQARELLFAEDRLKRFESEDELWLPVDRFFGEKPEWFLPKPIDHYEVWIFKEEPRQQFRLFIDPGTGELFLTDFQV